MNNLIDKLTALYVNEDQWRALATKASVPITTLNLAVAPYAAWATLLKYASDNERRNSPAQAAGNPQRQTS